MSADLPAMPRTVLAVRSSAALFNGLVHGDDAAGVVDVQFRNVHAAASFADLWPAGVVTPREPITSFTESVVVQVRTRS